MIASQIGRAATILVPTLGPGLQKGAQERLADEMNG
jgi:hypothetical protein